MSNIDTVDNLINNMGAPFSLKGVQYLKDAVRLVLEDRSRVYQFCEVYKMVAIMNGTSWKAVEKAMRYAVGKIMGNESNHYVIGIKEYLYGGVTNSSFICSVVSYINNMNKGEMQ